MIKNVFGFQFLVANNKVSLLHIYYNVRTFAVRSLICCNTLLAVGAVRACYTYIVTYQVPYTLCVASGAYMGKYRGFRLVRSLIY